jgi:hypothetical protein
MTHKVLERTLRNALCTASANSGSPARESGEVGTDGARTPARALPRARTEFGSAETYHPTPASLVRTSDAADPCITANGSVPVVISVTISKQRAV